MIPGEIMDRRPALGKGLSALIPDSVEGGSSTAVDIDRLTPNELQPRGHMDPESLADLSRSIASNGIIQPIVVRKVGDRFHIIAGERRWRAAKMAGLREVPVVVRDVGPGEDRSLLEVALIENIQREDLNPIEQALAYRRLADQFEMTQEAVATAVGKDRVTIANTVRLLKLPEDVRAVVASGALSMGHARALLALADESEQRRMAREVIARGLSVRETEALVKKSDEQPASTSTKAASVDVHTRAAEDRLRLVLGTRVRIVRRGTRGRIEIDFGSEDELIRIYEQLTERP
jgi:ParB family transcriptional regulator, chromosome partitioning protein